MSWMSGMPLLSRPKGRSDRVPTSSVLTMRPSPTAPRSRPEVVDVMSSSTSLRPGSPRKKSGLFSTDPQRLAFPISAKEFGRRYRMKQAFEAEYLTTVTHNRAVRTNRHKLIENPAMCVAAKPRTYVITCPRRIPSREALADRSGRRLASVRLATYEREAQDWKNRLQERIFRDALDK